MADELYSLKDAIAALRTEIIESAEQASNESLRFSLGDIELEFTVVAKRDTTGEAKMKFSILGIGADAGVGTKVAHEQTQKVKIKLSAQLRTPDGLPKDLLVGRKALATE